MKLTTLNLDTINLNIWLHDRPSVAVVTDDRSYRTNK